MTATEPIEDTSNPELMPVVRPTENAIGKAVEPHDIKPPMTAAQAKVDAVAALTMSAYEKASTLQLTDGEIEALQEDFPDEAFLPGAAGKENLIYCQHSYLRDRLNKVFRPGQWSIIPRNRWAEDFRTLQGKPASRVYVEAMLVIRGCFVAEAVGEMEYYPNNASQNYGDAVEGAKTAALRRCCKELGVGLQAWKKEWCEGWWARRQSRGKAAPSKSNAAPAPAPEPAKPAAKTRADATPEQKAKMVKLFEAEGSDAVQAALGYFIDVGAILPTETLEAVPLRFVPTTQREMTELAGLIAVCNQEGRSTRPSWAADPGRVNVVNPKPIDPNKPLVLPDGMEEEVGELQQVTVKEGKSAKGPWVLYGLLVNDKWHNSFSNTIGKAAQGAKGQEVRVIYLQTAKGRTVHDLVIDGFSVENPPQ